MSDTDRRVPWSMEAIIEWAEELGADGEHRGTDLLDLYAKLHGFNTHDEFVRWKYKFGPFRPSGMIFYCDYTYDKKI